MLRGLSEKRATMRIYTTINLTRLSVSDGTGRLIWVPYLRLAGRGRCAESRSELETVNK